MINVSDIIKEMEKLAQDKMKGEGATTKELMKLMGIGDVAVRDKLRVAIENNKIEPTKVFRKNLIGQMQQISAYRLVKRK